MNLNSYQFLYTFDKGQNLIQRTGAAGHSRMIAAAGSNRAINDELYSSLSLNPDKAADFNQTLINKGIFDKGGNQLKSVANSSLGWDHRSMLQSTVTDLKNEQGIVIGSINEFNLYVKAGRRNRKVTEKTDASGNVIEIQEALYLGNLEYRSTWTGSDLDYDGEAVRENNQVHSPKEAYVALRIRQGHKQVSEKRVYAFKDGIQVSEIAGFLSLDNNIDSCELQLNHQGNLESYYATKPYGETAVSYGKAKQHPYKYSGQEKDESGLYYYGYRSLLPRNFRWMSADPTGNQGSGLNWYAMVNGSPVKMRDSLGLNPLRDLIERKKLQGRPILFGEHHTDTGQNTQLINQHIQPDNFALEANAEDEGGQTKIRDQAATQYNPDSGFLVNDKLVNGYLSTAYQGEISFEIRSMVRQYYSSNPITIGHNVRFPRIMEHATNVTLRSTEDVKILNTLAKKDPEYEEVLKSDALSNGSFAPFGIKEITEHAKGKMNVFLVGKDHPHLSSEVKSVHDAFYRVIAGGITGMQPQSAFNLIESLNAVGVERMELTQEYLNKISSIDVRLAAGVAHTMRLGQIAVKYDHEIIQVGGVNLLVYWKGKKNTPAVVPGNNQQRPQNLVPGPMAMSTALPAQQAAPQNAPNPQNQPAAPRQNDGCCVLL